MVPAQSMRVVLWLGIISVLLFCSASVWLSVEAVHQDGRVNRAQRLASAVASRNERRELARGAVAEGSEATYAQQQDRLLQQLTPEEAAVRAAAIEAAEELKRKEEHEAELARRRVRTRDRESREAEARGPNEGEPNNGNRRGGEAGGDRNVIAARRACTAREERRALGEDVPTPEADKQTPNSRRCARRRGAYHNATDAARENLIQRIVQVRALRWDQMSVEEQDEQRAASSRAVVVWREAQRQDL